MCMICRLQKLGATEEMLNEVGTLLATMDSMHKLFFENGRFKNLNEKEEASVVALNLAFSGGEQEKPPFNPEDLFKVIAEGGGPEDLLAVLQEQLGPDVTMVEIGKLNIGEEVELTNTLPIKNNGTVH